MTKFTVQAVAARAFAVASFALATLPVAAVAIASQAHAAVPEAHIQVGDLNLSNPDQAQVFEPGSKRPATRSAGLPDDQRQGRLRPGLHGQGARRGPCRNCRPNRRSRS